MRLVLSCTCALLFLFVIPVAAQHSLYLTRVGDWSAETARIWQQQKVAVVKVTSSSTSSEPQSLRDEWTLDTLGHIVHHNGYYQKQKLFSAAYTYGDSSRLKVTEVMANEGPGKTTAYKTKYTYDAAGRLSKTEDYMTTLSETTVTLSKYNYDSTGTLVSIRISPFTGDPCETVVKVTDPDTLVTAVRTCPNQPDNTTKLVFSVDMSPVTKVISEGKAVKEIFNWTYRDDGQVLSEIHRIMGYTAIKTDYIYEDNGLLKEVICSDGVVMRYSYSFQKKK